MIFQNRDGMQSKDRFSIRGIHGGFAFFLMIPLVLICVQWDFEISKAIEKVKIPGDLNKAVQLSETFGHAFGPILIFSALLWIDLKNRKPLIQAAIFTALCGGSVNAAKNFIPRLRPHSLDRSTTEISSGWDTWGEPFTGSWFDEQFRSFPSGHSATAVGLAIGLAYVYPRGRWIFASIAMITCFQRLACNAHYLSDVVGGASIPLLLSAIYWKLVLGKGNNFRTINDGTMAEPSHAISPRILNE